MHRTPAGTRLEESFAVPALPGRLQRLVNRLFTGVTDREQRNLAAIRVTLDRIRAAAEQPAACGR